MKINTWGHGWHRGLTHSRDYSCVECGDQTMMLDKDFIENCRKNIIGFDAYEFAAMFRCPKCETVFWFHLNKDVAERFFRDFQTSN